MWAGVERRHHLRLPAALRWQGGVVDVAMFGEDNLACGGELRTFRFTNLKGVLELGQNLPRYRLLAHEGHADLLSRLCHRRTE